MKHTDAEALFVQGFNALAETSGEQVRIPEGSAMVMGTVEGRDNGIEIGLVIPLRIIVPYRLRRGYDFESDAEDDTPELPAPA